MAKHIKKAKGVKLKVIVATTAFMVYLLGAMGNGLAAGTSPGAFNEKVRKHLSKSYWRLPLRFESNQGQTDSRVKFLSRGLGYNLFLTTEEAVFSLHSDKVSKMIGKSKTIRDLQSQKLSTVFSIHFIGSNSSIQPKGAEELPIKTNYLIGNDPQNWRRNIPTYGKVAFKELYSGIDLIYYGNQRQLEFDFVVRPDGDHKSIRMKFKNVDRLKIDSQGNLILGLAGEKIFMKKPLVYQQVDGKKHTVPGHYKLWAKNIVGFQVASYNPKIPLVIDPVLNYSTYLGGNFNDLGNGIAVDIFGNAYVTGATQSTDFPTTTGAFEEDHQSLQDAFVTKLNSDGSDLLYSTYLGGLLNDDSGNDIAVDSSGNAYITGTTQSATFPTTTGAFQENQQSFQDAFVTKLNSDGSDLLYSTYLGGDFDDFGNGIAVDSAGNTYVIGTTRSIDFPTQDPLQSILISLQDAFVTKLNSAGSALIYSTYLGGDFDDLGNDIALDTSGNAYITGTTASNDFPIKNAFQPSRKSFNDVFVAKIQEEGDNDGTTDGGTGGGGGSGCFIATAAYGSPMEPKVQLLREFRDHFLLKSRVGNSLVSLYYAHSPSVAEFIASHDGARMIVRWILLPAVGFSWMVLRLGPTATILIIFMLLTAMSIASSVLFRRLLRNSTL